MTRVALDTNCLVAAACSWHEHHFATLRRLSVQAADGDEIVVPSHALAEAYAVLTRLPPPHRLSAYDAFAVLEGSWRNREAAALDAEAYWSVLESAAAEEVLGGSLYDALIVAAARQAGAAAILTWNTAQFQRLAGRDLRVDTPDSPDTAS